MVSLMPAIPYPEDVAQTASVRVRMRVYSPEELRQFPVGDLSGPEIRRELAFLKEEKEYRGPRTFTRVGDGRTLLAEARMVSSVPLEQRPTAAPASVVGTNTCRQVLPEGATVVRRPGEIPRILELKADRPGDTRAAQRPELVAPWTEWDANNRKGALLPSNTPEEKAVVRTLKK